MYLLHVQIYFVIAWHCKFPDPPFYTDLRDKTNIFSLEHSLYPRPPTEKHRHIGMLQQKGYFQLPTESILVNEEPRITSESKGFLASYYLYYANTMLSARQPIKDE